MKSFLVLVSLFIFNHSIAATQAFHVKTELFIGDRPIGISSIMALPGRKASIYQASEDKKNHAH